MRGHNSKVERDGGHERNMGIPAVSLALCRSPSISTTQDARCGTDSQVEVSKYRLSYVRITFFVLAYK